MSSIPFLGAATLKAPQATFDPVAETTRLLATLPADQRLRSDACFEGGYWLPLWGTKRGIGGADDLAGLPLLLAVLTVFFLLATPVSNAIVRTTESEADIFGINASREPDGFASVALKMVECGKLTPGRWEEIVFYDHPSGYDRVLMAMRWKAGHLEAPPPRD